MNELPTKYAPAEVEERLYQFWLNNNLFASTPDAREPYTIVIPPPNVTGVLHMGHMLNNTIQDILIRRARMEGKNALWVPGTDHASIATETKVIAKLKAQGINKTDLTREQFLEHAWDWTHTHGGIILQQLRKLGASCDWNRTAFTMDEKRSESVIKVFCDLYRKGLIYRGLRMVNWDPVNLTAISDDEVNYVEEHSKLYYLRYYVAGDPEGRYAVVATTRPETIMGDTAMCINPKDPKNAWLKGKRVIVPLVGREIPVIEDRYVEMDFGTGCLKVTPAHDKNDYQLGKTHNLESIDIFNPDATINANGGAYAGMDRFACRKQIAKDLAEAGLMEKEEDYTNKVGYSERTKAVIEPRLSEQWFLSMKHFADKSLAPVMDDLIRFVPEKYKTTYRLWLENIQDWCISRQLWWGHRIPAYYYQDQIFVAPTTAEALAEARKATGLDLQEADLRQDDDALDTWFSSWLWPITLFNGILDPNDPELKYYYPTSTLVTGPDIIFFWVARMIMAGYEYMGEMPFKNVYFTGIVRDKLGRKMSKSLGNSPDPLELIATYGADGVRMGMMLAAPAGNDIMFDEKLCEQGRNFCNKIWNAFRLIKGWEVAPEAAQPEAAQVAVKWFGNKLSEASAEITDLLSKFRISEALMVAYRLFWDVFSSWYLEMVKPAYGSPIDATTIKATLTYFDSLLRLLHPFMPFISEELWQHLEERRPGESIMYASLPATTAQIDTDILRLMDHAKEVINGVRGIRAQKQISPKVALDLQVLGTLPAAEIAVVSKLANLSAVASVSEKGKGAAQFMVDSLEFGIPMQAAGVDVEAERAKLLKDLEYERGFLASVEKKLSNERFVGSAPAAVVDAERRKQASAQQRIAALEASLAAL